MHPRNLMSRLRQRIAALPASVLTVFILTSCQSGPTEKIPAAAQGASANADELLPVDCLLPGQVRKLGSNLTFLTPRRPAKTTAVDCEIRGGEYVAFDRADYRTSLNVWLEDAKSGDPKAETYVGEIFEKGLGIPADYETARQWYLKAAAQDYSRAQINLGYLYEKGLGVKQDTVEALNWYRKASGLEEDGLEYASTVEVQAAAIAEQDTQVLRKEVERRKLEADALRGQVTVMRKELKTRELFLQGAETKLTALIGRVREFESTPTGNAGATETEVAARDPASEAKQQRLKSQITVAQARVERQRDKIAQLTAAMTQQNESIQSERQATQRHQHKLRQQVATIDKQAQMAQQELQKTRAQMARSQSRTTALKSRLARVRQLAEEIKTTVSAQDAAKVARLKQEISQREAEVTEQRTLVASLRNKIDRYPADANALEASTTPVSLAGPTIEILDPAIALTRGNMPSVQLRSPTKVRDVIGKVTAPAGLLSLTVNDRAATIDSTNGTFSASVPVEETDTPVTVAAVDKQGQKASVDFTLIPKSLTAASDEPVTRVAQAGSSEIALDGIEFGEYYALIIGNNKYSHLPDLKTAVGDAKEADELLRTKYGFHTTLLLNANRYAILSALNQLRETLTDQDNLLIYYAGHGDLDRTNLQGYWLPVDAEADSNANWIPNFAISELLNTMSAEHVLVVADSCYSGAMTRSAIARLETGMSDDVRYKWMSVMAKTRSRTVLSSGGDQPVLDSGGGAHSVFAKAFFNVLRGNDRVLEGYDVYRTIADQVQHAAAKFHIDQEPQYTPIRYAGHEAGEFLFVPSSLRVIADNGI